MEPYVKSGVDCNNSLLVRGDHVAYSELDYTASRGHKAVLAQGRVVGFRSSWIEIEPVVSKSQIIDRLHYDVIKVTK
jgi:hypothetical protein